METRANYAVVGVFVLAFMGALLAAALWFARAQIGASFAEYDVFFRDSVTGLAVGAPVRFNGIQAGRVTDIRVDPHDFHFVRVTLEVRPDIPVREDSVASMQSQGLTGVPYIEITGGRADSRPLEAAPGQRAVIASTRGGLNQAIASAPQLLDRVAQTLDRVNDVLGEANRASLNQTLGNVKRITGAVAAKSDDIGAIMDNAAVLTRDLHQTLAGLDRGIGQLTGVLAQANTTLQRVSALAESAGGVLTDVRPGVRGFSQTGFTELTQLLIEARQLVANWNRVAEQIQRDPERLLFGDRREGYRPR